MLFETRPVNGAIVPSVQTGTLIKVGCGSERFWCIVSQIKRNGRIVAIVDNDLISLPWHCGDCVHLKLDNILESSENGDSTHLSILQLAMSPLALLPLSPARARSYRLPSARSPVLRRHSARFPTTRMLLGTLNHTSSLPILLTSCRTRAPPLTQAKNLPDRDSQSHARSIAAPTPRLPG